MTITPEQIAEWRAEQGNGLTSAVGEYTPAEFWQLLDAYEALAKQAAEYEEALDMKEEKYGMPWRFWADKARELASLNTESADIEETAKRIYNADRRVGFWAEWEGLEPDDPTRAQFILYAQAALS